MTNLRKYLHRLLFEWVAVDPMPTASRLDLLDGLR